MAYIRTEYGFVNLATAVRVERDDYKPGCWGIIDAAGRRARFECSDDDIEARLNPVPFAYEVTNIASQLENIAYQLDRIVDFLEEIIGTAGAGMNVKYLRTLDIGRN